jgi:hypothetical protein
MIASNLASACFLLLFFAPRQDNPSAPAPPRIAPLWTWHTEEVEPQDVPRYEAAIAAIGRAQREAKVPLEVSGWYAIEIGLGRYINIAPLASYADLDRQPERRATLMKLVPDLPKLQEPLHGSLRTHHTKILRHQADASYLPAKPIAKQPVPGYLRIVLEWPRQSRLEDYLSATKDLREALARAEYPLACQRFATRQGEWDYVSVWEADSAVQFQQTPSVEEALARIPGGTELLERKRACLARVEIVEARPRLDLSALPPDAPAWIAR